MKKALKSYISFTRTERIGLVCLCSLLIILIAIRATMYLWVHPKIDPEKDKQLLTAWESFKRTSPASKPEDTTPHQKNDWQDAFDDNPAPLPAIIDLNTTDSATLVRLKGIGPVTAGKIIARRIHKGPYTDIEQIRESGSFSDATFTVLKQHLIIGKNSN